jgi:D-alanyl-D-alanine dipeptidase
MTRRWALALALSGALLCLLPAAAAGPRPELVDAARVVPDLVVEMRYHTAHNFVGAPVEGYLAPRCLLTRPAARALAAVQAELKPMGLGLKVYDCYRPARAVAHFQRWARDLDDAKTKTEFYPTVDKRDLFKLGYVAERSSHSRGSTVDLTIVPLPPPPQPLWRLDGPQEPCYQPAGERWPDNGLDMGGGFDCFHQISHTANPEASPQVRANRLLLKSLMERHGFVNYELEWWHYTLGDEPYPDTYFDVPVE